MAEHPDSPAAGSGPGSSRLPGSLGVSQSADVPHPEAPAARYGDWSVQAPSQSHSRAGQQRASLTREAVKSFDEQRQALRDALPDPLLQAVFDVHGDNVRVAFRVSHAANSERDIDNLLGRLYEAVRWIDPQVFVGRPDAGIGFLRHRQAGAPDTEVASVQALVSTVESTFALARTTLAQHWAAATSAGSREQRTLVDQWKRRMEFRFRGRPTGTGEERVRQVERPRPRPIVEPERKPVKTWVEFQVVDEDGKPVSDIAYEITLPDGSAHTGRSSASGAVRFDNIDPGQCQIRFPEIDAKEWHPA